MIKVSVFYPASDGAKFDMEYYCETHVLMVKQKLGVACKRIEIDQGVSGREPGSARTFAEMGHMYFDSVAEFQSVFGPHAQAFAADVPNYTTIRPVIQISDIKD